MFDLEATDGTVRKKSDKTGIASAEREASEAKGNPVAKKGHKLDGPFFTKLHGVMIDHYVRETDRQGENRAEQAEDEDFYDNEQWRDEDKATLEERGQVPLVYNVIATACDWVMGTEKRTRTDWKVLPRRKADSKPAERKTQLLKYLRDVNSSEYARSRAFEDAVKVGIGWLECGIQDDSDSEQIFDRYESWRNMLWDSSAMDLDLGDARYMFRSKWTDLDVGCALFPHRKGILEAAAQKAEDLIGADELGDSVMDAREEEEGGALTVHRSNASGYSRKRLRLIEAWFKIPVMAKRLKGGMFSGEFYDEFSVAHKEQVESGEAEIIEKVAMRMHVAIMTTAGMVWCSQSPYRHNRYPFTPVWGNKRGRTGLPYGMIRRLKSIQEDVNKRASKALHILSTNKTVMDDDALPEDMTVEQYLEEISRPDSVIRIKPGARLETNSERELAPAHLDLMSRGISMIQSASGVTDENLGRRTNATSGIAIERRQDQGSLTSMRYFDNLAYSMQRHGEKQLSMIEQFMSEKKMFRITNSRGTPEYVEINDDLPDNDIIRSKADFILSETDYNASIRQARASELLELLKTMPPEVALALLDLLVEELDVTNRDEIVRRIRSLTGQKDPDADEDEVSPEDEARAQAAAVAQQLTQAHTEATIRKLAADGEKSLAQAKELAAKTVKTRVDAQKGAIEAASTVMTMPAVADVADHILHETGFTSKTDEDAAAQQQQAELAAAEQQQAAQQQQAAAEQQQQQQQPEPAPGQQPPPDQQQPSPPPTQQLEPA